MAFIVFEGLDAAGKGTLISQVEKSLVDMSVSYQLFRDPGSTSLGESLRNIILSTEVEAPVPRAETLMYQAARVQMVEKKITPALKKGDWVLCDRFYSSTVAFQVFARDMDAADVDFLNQFVAKECPPDLFIFIDIPVSESVRRKEDRAKNSGVAQDRMEKEDINFQERVREGYLFQAKENPKKWLVLDGTLSPSQLLDKVIEELKARTWLRS